MVVVGFVRESARMFRAGGVEDVEVTFRTPWTMTEKLVPKQDSHTELRERKM